MRHFVIFFLTIIGIFVVDQYIKAIFVEGYYLAGECIDLELHYNRGVAFSMFSFLGDNLKWIQVALIVFILYFIMSEGFIKSAPLAVGMLMGGALGNLYDRFHHVGVVDYVAWHCGFDFAVFNFADVAIDIAVVWLLIVMFKSTKDSKEA